MIPPIITSCIRFVEENGKCDAHGGVLFVCLFVKGELSPNCTSLSEMSLPGVEVLIEKLLPEILGRLGKENPLKDDAKLPLYSAGVL